MNSLDKYVVCSECFKNYGLKKEAIRLGKQTKDICPICKSVYGYKLTQDNLNELTWNFFVFGSVEKFQYGSSEQIMFNDYHYKSSNVNFETSVYKDVELIENILKIGFFYYAPRLWRVGYNNRLINLIAMKEKTTLLKDIINSYPIKILTTKDEFYRIRKNPKFPAKKREFDSPPKGKGRFNCGNIPIFYATQNIEMGIHECRITIEDSAYVAVLKPLRNLKLLDLSSSPYSDDDDPFENLSIAINMLFSAEKHSYRTCRKFVNFIKENNYEGIVYPSYFNQIKSEKCSNIAIWGYPLKEKKLEISSINRIYINNVQYSLNYGPVIK